MKWKHFPRYRPFVREFTVHRWIPRIKASAWIFDVFFDLRPNKQLSNQSWCWWFETPSRSLWRHCNEYNMAYKLGHNDTSLGQNGETGAKWPTLNHWGRATHICVGKLTIIGSDNGLSPFRRQAIMWTNAWMLLIRTLATNFSEILGKIHSFSFKKMHLKMSSAKGRLFILGLKYARAIHWECLVDRTSPYSVLIELRMHNFTPKPVYNDHLMGYFSVFWGSSRWPRAT